MTSSRPASTCLARWSASGASGFGDVGCLASRSFLGAGDQPAFPPRVVVAVKALACELPTHRGLPLARWSVRDLQQAAVAHGLVAQISETTLWRWLSEDALCPWRHRSWIFPRAPAFATKAGRILDLYARAWEGEPLRPDDPFSGRSPDTIWPPSSRNLPPWSACDRQRNRCHLYVTVIANRRT